jgi:hypothetical protein
MSRKNAELDRYENEAEVRELIRLLEAARPPSDLKAPADFYRQVLEKVEQRPARVGLFERWRKGRPAGDDSRFVRLLGGLRSLVLHPAFAYGLVLLLGVPVLRSYYLDSAELAAVRRGGESSLTEVLDSPSRGLPRAQRKTPQEATVAFLREAYRPAYETRNLETLARVWQMDEAWRSSLGRLFAESRRVALLIDVDEQLIELKGDGRQVLIPFAQAVAVVDREGYFSLQGPFFCLADIRLLDSDKWEIQDLRDDPRRGGQCRPQG